MSKKNWDYARILTKDELIAYLKRDCYFQSPTEQEIKFWKWCKEIAKLEKEEREYLNDNTGKILAKELDGLIRKFNQEKDINETVILGKEISKKHSLLAKELDRSDNIQEKRKQINKLVGL